MDGAGDQLLARAGLAIDQYGGIGGGDAADLVEHRQQGGTAADDLLEIVRGLDLFLEVEVLLVQPRALGLGEDAVGDVDPDRMRGLDRPGGAAHRSHPEADPEGVPVPPAHLQLQAGDLLAGKHPMKCFLGGHSTGRRVCEVGQDARTDQLRGRIAEELGRTTVHVVEPAVSPERHIGARRLIVEVPVAPLALQEFLLDPQALELGGRTGGEDPEDEESTRLGRHGPLVEHGQMPEDVPLPVQQGNPEVALDPQVDQPLVAGELFLDPAGVVAEPPAHDVLARSPVEVVLFVRAKLALSVVGERADPRRDAGKLGDEGIAHLHRTGQMLHQGLEEGLARVPYRPLDDLPQRSDLVVIRGRKRFHPFVHLQVIADWLRDPPRPGNETPDHKETPADPFYWISEIVDRYPVRRRLTRRTPPE